MKCKKCKREVQKEFNFCPYCGYRFIPDATEIKVPEPKRLANGSYQGQPMYNGKRYTVTAPTLEEYKAKARDIKMGNVPVEQIPDDTPTLSELVERYLADIGDDVRETTLYEYNNKLKNRFPDAMDCYVDTIDWQKLINRERRNCADSTVATSWGLIKAALTHFGYAVPDVKAPPLKSHKTHFLDDKEIIQLLEYVKGSKWEATIILLLHSLRREEVTALNVEDIYDGFIHVNKTMVDSGDGPHIVELTKTEKSRRDIPVFYDRLYEILPDTGRIYTFNHSYLARKVRSLCERAGVTECTAHDLRRSFASLAYSRGVPERRIMEYGGWSTPAVMHECYIRLYAKDSEKDAQPLKNYFNFTAMQSTDQ